MALAAPVLAPAPIRIDAGGVARVGSTRVTLDSVVSAFDAGCGIEEIAGKYPTLHLADVYAVITYTLQNREEVDAYLQLSQIKRDASRQEWESLAHTQELRRRLLSLKAPADTPC
ncbi:MAG: DUF433 domain-containing protein [Armatimonadetes bacterium]|nr:DUF433 domain-containing protein [Armatimonadota bacterium]